MGSGWDNVDWRELVGKRLLVRSVSEGIIEVTPVEVSPSGRYVRVHYRGLNDSIWKDREWLEWKYDLLEVIGRSSPKEKCYSVKIEYPFRVKAKDKNKAIKKAFGAMVGDANAATSLWLRAEECLNMAIKDRFDVEVDECTSANTEIISKIKEDSKALDQNEYFVRIKYSYEVMARNEREALKKAFGAMLDDAGTVIYRWLNDRDSFETAFNLRFNVEVRNSLSV